MTGTRAQRERKRLIRLASIVLATVLVGGVIADRVIVSHIQGQQREKLLASIAQHHIFARSPAAGVGVTMPLDAPNLLVYEDGVDPGKIEPAAQQGDEDSDADANDQSPRRWFVETGNRPIDAMAQVPVRLSQNWYSGPRGPTGESSRPQEDDQPRADSQQ